MRIPVLIHNAQDEAACYVGSLRLDATAPHTTLTPAALSQLHLAPGGIAFIEIGQDRNVFVAPVVGHDNILAGEAMCFLGIDATGLLVATEIWG